MIDKILVTVILLSHLLVAAIELANYYSGYGGKIGLAIFFFIDVLVIGMMYRDGQSLRKLLDEMIKRKSFTNAILGRW